ncbi:hypothetical protein G7Y89_g11809 [Cudoniella acicularis]|uniref:Major facilitator superfamily (MFS) profile domain-containing protein n=1 Tax=Cudoniella acicularis TaxID=354080 RepID=A0A8H4RBA9_9HELO|nr:hypothetical protein G7Y89_g11809 [Cudoniella acicularis]
MDPLSIISVVVTSAKTLSAVTRSVLTFIDGVRTINQSINGIYDELDSLCRTIEAINGGLATPALTNAIGGSQETGGLWPVVLKSLQDCDLTIHELYDCLQGFNRQSSNVAARTVIAIRFNRTERQAQVLKNRVFTHNTSLQHLCCQSPGIVVDDLSKKIELLVDMISQLDAPRDRVEGLGTLKTAHPNSSDDGLLNTAQQVALDANTVLTRSEGGSIAGGSLKTHTRSSIEKWLEQHLPEDGFIETDSDSATSQTQITPSESSDNQTARPDVSPGNDSEDDEFEIEVIEASLSVAHSEFAKPNYSTAEPYFHRVYNLAKNMSVPTQNRLHLKDVQLKASLCSLHLGNFEKAESVLQDLRCTPPASQQDFIWSLDASHRMAEIHISNNNVEKAEDECRRALAGRRKVLGKDHPSYFETLSLLSMIMEFKGDRILAESYRIMIKEDVLDPLVQSRRRRKVNTFNVRTSTTNRKIGDVEDMSPEDKELGLGEIKSNLLVHKQESLTAHSLLHDACEKGLYSAAHFLLMGYPIPRQYTLLTATQDIGTLQPEDLLLKKANGQTVLHAAAYGGNIDIVKLLFVAGAVKTRKDDSGKYPWQIGWQPHPENKALYILLHFRDTTLEQPNDQDLIAAIKPRESSSAELVKGLRAFTTGGPGYSLAVGLNSRKGSIPLTVGGKQRPMHFATTNPINHLALLKPDKCGVTAKLNRVNAQMESPEKETDIKGVQNPVSLEDVTTVKEIGEESRRATEAEHRMTFMQGLKLYPKAIGWSAFFSMGVIMTAFDPQLLGSLYATPAFQRDFGYLFEGSYIISAPWQTALGMGNPLGQVVGALAAGYPMEWYGRKWTFAACVVGTAAFIFNQFFAKTIESLLVGELIGGLILGTYTTIAPTYASEVVPIALRGHLTAYINLCFVIGQLLANGVIAGTGQLDNHWAYSAPFAIQWLWPALILIGTPFAPESPWWLIRKGRFEDAEKALNSLSSSSVDNKLTLAMMIETDKLELEMETGTTYLDCFKSVNWRRTEISIGVFVVQVLSGIYMVGYAALFFELAGLDTTQSFNMSVGFLAVGFVGTCLSWILISKYGRRRIYNIGLALLTIIMFIIGFLDIVPNYENRPGVIWAQCILMIIWNGVFDLSIGPICYVIICEASATKVRTKTIAIATAAQAIFAIVMTVAIPYMINPDQGNWRGKLGFFFGGLSLISFVWCWYRIPETKNRTYEELDLMFERNVKTREFKNYKIL